jgi:VIT1/CCC1 family predicted Fe2+/Mn2+ transporter
VAVATRNDGSNELRERPIGEVAKELTSDLSLLVRQEIELAKAEMAEKGRTAAPGLGMFGGAGIVALCAAGAITAFLVLVFSLFLPEWAAALIVGAVLAAVAYVLIKQGKERVAEAGKPVPEQTIETVKEDVEWAKTRASSARK